MMPPGRRAEALLARVSLALLLALVGAPMAAAQAASPTTTEAPFPIDEWQTPPPDLRPVARWWWPGGSVDPEVLSRQLRQIADAGFGGVELQPLLLGLGDEDLAADPHLRTVGEASFAQSVAHAAAEAAGVGLAFDFTLGSGWPGGLPTGKKNAERQLVMGTLDVEGPSRFEGPLPDAPDQSYRRAVEWVLDVLGPMDLEAKRVAVLAGRLGPERDGVPTLEDVRVITPAVRNDRLGWDVPEGSWRIFALYENSTEHFVMGGAFPGAEADARVVDHLSERGAHALLTGYADPVLDAVAPGQVREIFVDSFELMGELPFTAGLLDAFANHTGYDLTPHLPLLFRVGGESKYGEMMDLFERGGGPAYVARDPERAERIREDYEAVRALLFQKRFVDHIARWTHERGLSLRLQAHGGYGDYLDTYARADVPESEALFGGGSSDFLKLAASAAHVAGRRFASSESFITLRLFGTRLSFAEMMLLTGRAYSTGINRLAFHGVPYPYERADGEAWFPFSGGFGRILAGPLPMSSQFNGAFLRELPDFNRFLGRLTVAMSHGDPAADVAWLRADPIYPDTASLQLGEIEPRSGESDTAQALRARGLVHDRVSRTMLAGATSFDGSIHIGAGRYRAVLLDPLAIADPELVERLADMAEAGVLVLALGDLPRRAPGLSDAEARDARVRAASKRLAKRVVHVPQVTRLESLLAQHLKSAPVAPLRGKSLNVSIDRRRSKAGDTILLFNESWTPQSAGLRFTRGGGPLLLWDPYSGKTTKLRDRVQPEDIVNVDLEAAETRILTLGALEKPSHPED